MTTDDLDRFFTYHPPTPDQIPRLRGLTSAASLKHVEPAAAVHELVETPRTHLRGLIEAVGSFHR